MILTKKEIEEKLINFDIPAQMSNEIALLLLDNNPKNLLDLNTEKCVKSKNINSNRSIDVSTSCSDITDNSFQKWNLEPEKDR